MIDLLCYRPLMCASANCRCCCRCSEFTAYKRNLRISSFIATQRELQTHCRHLRLFLAAVAHQNDLFFFLPCRGGGTTAGGPTLLGGGTPTRCQVQDGGVGNGRGLFW